MRLVQAYEKPGFKLPLRVPSIKFTDFSWVLQHKLRWVGTCMQRGCAQVLLLNCLLQLIMVVKTLDSRHAFMPSPGPWPWAGKSMDLSPSLPSLTYFICLY